MNTVIYSDVDIGNISNKTWKEYVYMAKTKIIETILSAISAIITAVSSIIKFIGYISKLKPISAEN